MKKGVNIKRMLVVLLISFVLIIPFISGGLFQNTWDKITGKATTSPVTISISLTSVPPIIYNISYPSPIVLNEGPALTFVVVNFSVNATNGAASLINNSAMLNLTRTGQPIRLNGTSCAVKDWSGNYANYTCNVTMYWYDQDGAWTIDANISDFGGNYVINHTKTVTVNTLTGMVMSPTALSFASITAGAFNQTATNDPLTLNNTGNQNITAGNLKINAIDLSGETDHGKFLFASNFSASNWTGGNIECNTTGSSTSLVNITDTAIVGSTLTIGNFQLNDGNTGQEQLYVCLKKAGYELTQQAYSTNGLGTWTVKIA
jgi:hypothetical protein